MLQCMQGTSIIQNVSMAPSMNTFLIVTIVEIHMIILCKLLFCVMSV